MECTTCDFSIKASLGLHAVSWEVVLITDILTTSMMMFMLSLSNKYISRVRVRE
jgi:hypothetical protein